MYSEMRTQIITFPISGSR